MLIDATPKSDDVTMFQLPNGIVLIAKVIEDTGRFLRIEKAKIIQAAPNGQVVVSNTDFTKLYKSGMLEGPAPQDLVNQLNAKDAGIVTPNEMKGPMGPIDPNSAGPGPINMG